jgi:hypothetical protein
VRPTRVLYTGDGTGSLTNLRWSVWSRTRALGSGTDWIANCVPDCASAKRKRVPARVWATRPVAGRFTRLTIQHEGERPDTLFLCPDGSRSRYVRWGVHSPPGLPDVC